MDTYCLRQCLLFCLLFRITYAAIGPRLKAEIHARCNPIITDSPYTLRFNPPPVLYTYPGAGNTMTRLLIDHVIKGYHSGSVYHDKSLIKVLPGEDICHRNMTVVKAHPTITYYSGLFENHNLLIRTHRHCYKCIPKFDAAVIVTRHPLRTVFAEYNRVMHPGFSHTGHIPRKRFNASHFEHFAIDNAKKIISVYRGSYRHIKKALRPDHVLACKFENLVHRDMNVRVAELRKIVEFLILDGPPIKDEQLISAFKSKEVESEHRPRAAENEVSFGEGFPPALRSRVWDLIGDAMDNFAPEYARDKMIRPML